MNNILNVDKVIVLHVKKGSEERAKRMELMLSKMGIEFEYMLDGDVDDLSDERMAKYFDPSIQRKAATSCSMKHILTMERLVNEGLERVLVLEDDAILHRNFVSLFNKSMDELDKKEFDNEPYMIFYEATFKWYIPRSQRRKGQMLYHPRSLQCAACYVVNRAFAQLFLDHIGKTPVHRPIDETYSILYNEGMMPNLYQSHPDLCEQGSHIGTTQTLIGNSTFRKKFGYLRYRLNRFYKKNILYNLR